MVWQKRITSVEGANALFGEKTLSGTVTEGAIGGYRFTSSEFGNYEAKTLTALCLAIIVGLVQEIKRLRAEKSE